MNVANVLAWLPTAELQAEAGSWSGTTGGGSGGGYGGDWAASSAAVVNMPHNDATIVAGVVAPRPDPTPPTRVDAGTGPRTFCEMASDMTRHLQTHPGAWGVGVLDLEA